MDYRIIRSSRKTISIQITPEGEVVVRCPKRTGAAQIRSAVESKRSWIEAHLRAVASRPPQPKLSPSQLKELKLLAKQTLPRLVDQYAPAAGVSFGRVSIRAQKTRWGSCSAKGDLNFNCLLMLAPPEVPVYVVVHELCHRLEMNHSARFWQEVERILPDYRTPRKWLKDNGASLIARLPDSGSGSTAGASEPES